MLRLLRASLLVATATLVYAEDKPPTPIPAEYVTLGSALSTHQQQIVQQANKLIADISAAQKLLEGQLCKSAGLEAMVCLVDWQKGIIGVKPPVEEKEVKP